MKVFVIAAIAFLLPAFAAPVLAAVTPIAGASKRTHRRLFISIVAAMCVAFAGTGHASDEAKRTLANKVSHAPDAMKLRCKSSERELVFDFTVSKSLKAVVWSTDKSRNSPPSVYMDGKDTGLGFKATVKSEANKISWTVKTAYGRNFGSIDLAKLALDMHSIFSGEDIVNTGACARI